MWLHNISIYVLSTQSAHEYFTYIHSTILTWYQHNDTCYFNHTHITVSILWWSANVQITETLCVTNHAVYLWNLSCIWNRTCFQFIMSIMLSYVQTHYLTLTIYLSPPINLSVYYDNHPPYPIWLLCTLLPLVPLGPIVQLVVSLSLPILLPFLLWFLSVP